MSETNVIVSELCSAIKSSFYGAEFVYKNGSCYEFYKILKKVFPDAVPWTNCDHVWAEINGKLYDIDGERKEGYSGLVSDISLFRDADHWSSRSKWRICVD